MGSIEFTVFTVAAAIVAIGVLVTVHEYGHYIVARACGIKVLRFSVGFGKPLWRRVAGPDDTEYVISRIPLGGYVKMLDTRDGPVPEGDRGRAFNDKSVPARMAVLVAGPLFNFFFAILAFWLVFGIGIPEAKPVVGYVAEGSDAERAGIASMDELVAVDGTPVVTWGEANIQLLEAVLRDGPVTLTVINERRAERELSLRVTGDRTALTEPGQLLEGIGLTPWQPALPAVIANVEADSPAARGGLQVGDRIIALDGEAIDDWSHLVRVLVGRAGEQVALEVLRDDRPRTLDVTLGARESDGESRGYLGVGPEMMSNEEYRAAWGDMIATSPMAVLPALGKAVKATGSNSVLMLKMFGKMITNQVSWKNISGPITIAQYAGYTARDGPVYYLRFLALLSLSLGVLNLLPIPMLDGGQLVYQMAEAVKGSPVSMRTEIIGQQIGIVMLLLLMSVAFYQDFARLVLP